MPTCLITGANRGLGLEFAKQYAADDWKVIATCRRPDEAEDLGAVEGSVEIYPLDVTDFARVEQLARKLSGVAIDLLINNAGIYGPRVVPYKNVEYALWCEVLRVNTMAPLKVSATFLDHLGRGRDKKIVTISSKMGSIADNTSGGVYIYRSSKAALNAVMKSLSIDLRDQGFTVVVLNPGWVRTDMGGSSASIDSFESVAGMRDVINNLRVEDSGRFLHYDGTEIPW
ncbi:MAG: SDR family oxidoreductase [Hyphomicrobium sp.]|jgi:NAD(P)-dependent dehydrogenase (short-subunit alcohol dehydrogenase family)